jgi:hypothetical protein
MVRGLYIFILESGAWEVMVSLERLETMICELFMNLDDHSVVRLSWPTLDSTGSEEVLPIIVSFQTAFIVTYQTVYIPSLGWGATTYLYCLAFDEFVSSNPTVADLRFFRFSEKLSSPD